MGYIREVKVNVGDHAGEGQLLVVIDSRDLDTAVFRAKAVEQEATSGIAEADHAVSAAKAQLHLAQVTFRRMEDLFHQKSISNQEFDEAQARLQSAAAAHQMALSRRAQLDSKMAQARQAAELAAVNRSYAEIRAPFAGVVIEKRAEPGQTAIPGAPLLTIERAGGYRFEAAVEEALLGQIRLGQTASVLIGALNQILRERIIEIVPAIDPASRSFVVKTSLRADPALRSGLFGRMRVTRGSKQAIAIPATAITRQGQIESVFVVENGVARTRMVTSGARHGEFAEVLSGLQPAETIVSVIPANLTDGARIEAANESSSLRAAGNRGPDRPGID
jgi:RND family efflux transporter MFP subunit